MRNVLVKTGASAPNVRLPVDTEGRLIHLFSSIVYCGWLIVGALAIGFLTDRILGVQSVLLVFLAVILLAAVKHGFWAASTVALVGVLATSYFFAEPRHSLAVSDPGNVWVLAVFLLASGLISSVGAQARQRAESTGAYSRALEQLHAVTPHLFGLARRSELADAVVSRADKLMACDVVWLERASAGGAEFSIRARAPIGLEFGADELAHAQFCIERPHMAAARAGGSPEISWCFREINMGQQALAVLGIRPRAPMQPGTPAATRLADILVEQIEAVFERMQLAEETRRAEVLAETDRLRTAILTSMSHDLKTPLTSILGNVTSLRRYDHLYDAATRCEMLDQAGTEILRLNRFVDNLLHMTRLEAGAIKPNLELIDLSDVIDSALKRSERVLVDHVVDTQVDDAAPMLMLDFALTEQVLANLLDNAAKYSEFGTQIGISVSSHGDSVAVIVRDEGLGIAAQDAARIFDRFFRIETEGPRPSGAGLGLAICKGFVEAMGGTISVANRASGKGAEFTVRFPIGKPKSGA